MVQRTHDSEKVESVFVPLSITDSDLILWHTVIFDILHCKE